VIFLGQGHFYTKLHCGCQVLKTKWGWLSVLFPHEQTNALARLFFAVILLSEQIIFKYKILIQMTFERLYAGNRQIAFRLVCMHS
jgi:hypothetical protein